MTQKVILWSFLQLLFSSQEPDPNFGQGWEHILDEVDKQQLESQRPIRTSAEADLIREDEYPKNKQEVV